MLTDNGSFMLSKDIQWIESGIIPVFGEGGFTATLIGAIQTRMRRQENGRRYEMMIKNQPWKSRKWWSVHSETKWHNDSRLTSDIDR